MPRDKSFSHEKVNRAIKEEFLAKGYEGASIRSIGEKAGMTSAGFEPIMHDYDDSKIKKYLNTLQEFFMPGWIRIM